MKKAPVFALCILCCAGLASCAPDSGGSTETTTSAEITYTTEESSTTETSNETTTETQVETQTETEEATTEGTTSTTISETTTSVSSEAQTPKPSAVNILTGLAAANPQSATTRPVAVMVNNVTSSLPQYGTAAADIIFETLVEGGITRLMAVYPDYTAVPDVCSVRSCRYYFPKLAMGLDAVYVHWGSDQTIALDTLNSTGIDRLDGGSVGSSAFGRDSERKATYALEHTGYLKGSALASTIKSLGYRTKLSSEKTAPVFNFGSTAVTPSGGTATKIKLPYSGSYYSDFVFNNTTKTYAKSHNGNAHMDSKAGKQLTFTNVFVLKTNISSMGDGSPLMKVDLSGGSGYYITGGRSEAIRWSKASDSSPIVFTRADGSSLTVSPGKSYIGIIGNDRNISIS